MNLYETTFIINPQTDDATIDRQVRDVAELITKNDGQIRFEDHMGTRRLAYEINGLTQGYYASFIFEAPTSLLPVLGRHYKLNEAYIRHLTVRFEGDQTKLAGFVEAPPEATEDKPGQETETASEDAAGSVDAGESLPVVEEQPKEPSAAVEPAIEVEPETKHPDPDTPEEEEQEL
jgi:small subunit ribosomal protein S6